jgi:PAS domain S-box-containing protein
MNEQRVSRDELLAEVARLRDENATLKERLVFYDSTPGESSSEAKHRIILDNLPDTITEVDCNLNVVWANRAALELNPHVIGLPCYRTFAALEASGPCEACPCMEAIRTGEVKTSVKRRAGADDETDELYTEVTGVPLCDEHGNVTGVLQIGRNVTKTALEVNELITSRDELEQWVRDRTRDLAQANERLRGEVAVRRAAEERYRNLFEQAPVGIVRTAPDGRFISVNPMYARMLGYDTPEDLMASINDMGRQMHVDPEDGRKLKFDQIRQGSLSNLEYRLKRKDGAIVWVSANWRAVRNASGSIVAYDVFLANVTAHKQAEEALRASESKYRSLVDNALEAIIVTQGDGLVFANQRTMEATGYTLEELTSRPFTDLMHPDDRQEMVENYLKRLKGEIGPASLERRAICKDGSLKWFENKSVLIEWDGGPAVLGLCADITEKKQAETLLVIQRDLGVALSAVDNMDQALEVVLECTLKMEPFAAGIVLRPDEHGGLFMALQKGVPDEFIPYLKYFRPDWGGTRAVMEGRPIYDAGPETFPESIPIVNKIGIRSAVVLPIKSEGRVIAALALGSPPGQRAQPAVRNALESIVASMEGVMARVEAEEALRASEAKYRLLVDNALEAITVSQGDHLVFVNPRSEEISGYTAKELMTLPFAELVHPDDRQVMLENYYRRLTMNIGPGARTHRVFCKDGSMKYVEIKSVNIEWNGKPATLNLIADVTAHKFAEDALAESERRARALLNATPDYMMLLDGNLNIVAANEPVARFLGKSEKGLRGHPIGGNLSPIMNELRETWSQHVIVTAEPAFFEDQIGESYYSHSVYPVTDAHGRVTGLAFYIQDITLRKQAEKALVDSERTARALLNATPDYMMLLDRQLNILAVNRTVEEIVDCPELEIIGRPAKKVLPPSLAGFQEKMARLVLEGDIPVSWLDERQDRYFQFNLYPVFGATGDVTSLAAYARDITDQKLAERKLVDYQDRLRQLASELSLTESRERRRIAADLHDRIGQILFLTKMKLEDLESLKDLNKQSELTELARESVKLVEQALHDTRGLIMEISPPALHVLGLEAALNELADRIRDEHGLAVNVLSSGQPASLSADMRDVLYRAAQEVVFNAVKHSSADNLFIKVAWGLEHIRVDVSDDGKGFNVRPAAPAGNGGYGLFSIGERLGALGGTLKVFSKVGRGTQISMTAPLDGCERSKARETYGD